MTDTLRSPKRRALVTGIAGIGLVAAFGLTGFIPDVVNAANDADVSDTQAYQLQQADKMIIVDIRTPPEWQQTGIAKGALTIDMTAPDFLNKMVALKKASPDKEIGLMCRTSHRSSAAQKELVQAGFDKVYSIFGGIAGNGVVPGWIADGLPTEKCC